MKNKMKKLTKKADPQLPGYPKYPADEDIMNRGNRVMLDENAPPVKGTESLDMKNSVSPKKSVLKFKRPGNPDPLDPENKNEEEFGKRIYPVDFSGKDLDVPGAELDDETEKTGNEDEENNLYSLGNKDQ